MIFFSNNLCYINFFSEMYYHVFSTKADQKGGSIHKKKNLSTEIHILVLKVNIMGIVKWSCLAPGRPWVTLWEPDLKF